MTPSPLVQLRARRWLAIAALGLVIAASLLFGIERRRLAEEAIASKSQNQLAALLQQYRVSGLSELTTWRDQLRITRQRFDGDGGSRHDAATAITSLLMAWPSGDAAPIVQTESLTVTSDMITMQAMFYDRESATLTSQLLARFSDSPSDSPDSADWALGEPQITSLSGASGQPSFRASFRFIRTISTSNRIMNGSSP